ncbi:MAG: GNAT family N-acetyltransferase [Phormidesmis sp.]
MTLPQMIDRDPGSTYIIKTATRDELALAVEWAAAEGWNPGLQDAECFYNADPNGFFIGLLAGEPVASISAVKYNEAFGFLGLYIVRPEFRGHGYGLQIWQAGVNYLEGCNIGLDGVVEQQNNYVESGFELAHRNIRYEGIGGGTVGNEDNLVPLSSLPLSTVIKYDKEIFLAERSAFLAGWLGPQHTAIGAMHDQKLAGYGVLRPCQQGYKMGPLFADSAEIAEAIFLALKARVEPDSFFYLDVPEVNLAAVALASKEQMTRVFETARMYTQSAPELPLKRIFGITTFELG